MRLLRLERGPPRVGAVRVVRLSAAAVGELADGVELCFVCCAVLACFVGVEAEQPPLVHWDSGANCTCDLFDALAFPIQLCSPGYC